MNQFRQFSIVEMLNYMVKRPGAFFGRKDYTFAQAISFLDGYAVAQNAFGGRDERFYDVKVKSELVKRYGAEYELKMPMHILDMFDAVCENEEDKLRLLAEIVNTLDDKQELFLK